MKNTMLMKLMSHSVTRFSKILPLGALITCSLQAQNISVQEFFLPNSFVSGQEYNLPLVNYTDQVLFLSPTLTLTDGVEFNECLDFQLTQKDDGEFQWELSEDLPEGVTLNGLKVLLVEEGAVEIGEKEINAFTLLNDEEHQAEEDKVTLTQTLGENTSILELSEGTYDLEDGTLTATLFAEEASMNFSNNSLEWVSQNTIEAVLEVGEPETFEVFSQVAFSTQQQQDGGNDGNDGNDGNENLLGNSSFELPEGAEFDTGYKNNRRTRKAGNSEASLRFTRTNFESWTSVGGSTIEAWNTGGVELNGTATDFGVQQTVALSQGLYRLDYKHRGRRDTRANNSYTLTVICEGEEEEQTLFEQGFTVPAQANFTTNTISFCLFLADDVESKNVTIQLKPTKTGNPIGTLVDDFNLIKTSDNPIQVVQLFPAATANGGALVASEDSPLIDVPNTGALLTPFVEQNPVANRIAHRELKIEVCEELAGEIVTWSYEVVPDSMPATIRGNLNNFVDDDGMRLERFDDFETSTGFIDGDGIEYAFAMDEGAFTTEIDDDGFSGIRVNIPPIGLNRARVIVEIADVEYNLIDMEVPAVVMIDPGHGGNNGTQYTGIREDEMALQYSLSLRDELNAIYNTNNRGSRILMTRVDDTFIANTTRQPLAANAGADVFLSVHFNSAASDATGTETFVERTMAQRDADIENKVDTGALGENINQTEDIELARVIQLGSFAAVEAADQVAGTNLARHRGSTVTPATMGVRRAGFLVTRDGGIAEGFNGNETIYSPIRSVLAEIEFMDEAQILELMTLTDDNPSGIAARDEFAETNANNIYNNILNHVDPPPAPDNNDNN